METEIGKDAMDLMIEKVNAMSDIEAEEFFKKNEGFREKMQSSAPETLNAGNPPDLNKILSDYQQMTGQTFQYIMSGAMQYGDDFIIFEILTQALDEHKKLVWETDLTDGENLGQLNYKLVEI